MVLWTFELIFVPNFILDIFVPAAVDLSFSNFDYFSSIDGYETNELELNSLLTCSLTYNFLNLPKEKESAWPPILVFLFFYVMAGDSSVFESSQSSCMASTVFLNTLIVVFFLAGIVY